MTRRELFGHLLSFPLVGGLAMLAAKAKPQESKPGPLKCGFAPIKNARRFEVSNPGACYLYHADGAIYMYDATGGYRWKEGLWTRLSSIETPPHPYTLTPLPNA